MKTIRLIIVLALIFGSLALDMSSAKERSATSAYTTLYTELGFTEGYKSMYGYVRRNATPKTFQFFISVMGANGKINEIGASSVQNTPGFVQDVSASISFPTTPTLKALFPQWMQTECTNQACTFHGIKSFTNLKNSNYYFQVELNKDNKSFQIVITNGARVSYSPEVIPEDLIAKQSQIFASFKPARTQRFWNAITSMKDHLDAVMRTLNAFKIDVKGRTDWFKSQIALLKTDIGKQLKKKEALKKEIEIINANIDRKKTSILTKQSLKAKCEDELINLMLQIQAEEKRIAAATAAAALELSNAKKNKAEKIKLCFFYIEASFYYRVFAEKLVKTEADLIIATTGAALTATQNKIKTAFFPVLVTFAGVVAK